MNPRFKTTCTSLALFSASMLTSATLLLAVGAAFHQPSSAPWLSDTPQARREVARCAALAERSATATCLRELASAARERDAGQRWAAAAASAATPPAGRR